MILLNNRFALITIMLVFTAVSFPRANQELITPVDKNAKKEANYLSAINSGNESLRINSAFMLGEMRSKKAVIPLMDMFRQDKDEGAKLVAALSLLKIGDARGMFLVKRSIELNENEGITIILRHLIRDFGSQNNEILD
ncbi:MAG: HEAT repeat domain-containing protein [Ignavibacteriaceae bacterium]